MSPRDAPVFRRSESAVDHASALRLRLPPSLGLGCGAFLLVFGAGLFAVVFFLAQDIAGAPGFFRSAYSLLALLVSLWLGTLSVAYLLVVFAHELAPSRLDGDASSLRVHIWRTEERYRDNFRRTDVLVPRDQIAGVVFGRGQGGQVMLHVLHSSGLAFDTGWRGLPAEAPPLREALLRWLVRPAP